MAFDAIDGSHLKFLDAAFVMLRSEAALGNILGGHHAIRFVGRLRAVLSPQRSTMTCMVEAVSLRLLGGTDPLLAKLEALGRSFGGVQHWAMFNDLRAGDVDHAPTRA